MISRVMLPWLGRLQPNCRWACLHAHLRGDCMPADPVAPAIPQTAHTDVGGCRFRHEAVASICTETCNTSITPGRQPCRIPVQRQCDRRIAGGVISPLHRVEPSQSAKEFLHILDVGMQMTERRRRIGRCGRQPDVVVAEENRELPRDGILPGDRPQIVCAADPLRFLPQPEIVALNQLGRRHLAGRRRVFLDRVALVGLSLIGGVETAFAETYMQVSGAGLQMEASAFQRELDENSDLRRRLFRYNEAMHAQTAQTAACNGRHELEQRLARWLLMAHDRTDGDELLITQEFLSLMLCVYRPSVTVVAGILQRAGIICYSKGNITILDREALEATACDCYRTVQDRADNLAVRMFQTVKSPIQFQHN